jgi:two-component system OmpR family sensor kinase
VLGNLIENSSQNGATEVEVSAARSAQGLFLTVQDNGPGISAANAEKLFTPFFTTRREKGGTGLGLVILRSLLRAHGADITFIPSPAGACFVVEFSNI